MNSTEKAIIDILNQNGGIKCNLCTFGVNTLSRKSFRVRKLEKEFIAIGEQLAESYRLQCPKDFKDWNIMVVPKFLNMIGCAIENVMHRDKPKK